MQIEGKRIDITDVVKLQHPFQVLVSGAIASGKNHVVREYLSEISMIDIDRVMEEHGWTDYRSEFAQAMEICETMVSEHYRRRESFVSMGTGSFLPRVIDRLFQAKQEGYTTVLLYVDAPVEQCFEQNAERRLKGKRALDGSDLYKIVQTHFGARETYDTLRFTNLVDHFCHYDNKRKE